MVDVQLFIRKVKVTNVIPFFSVNKNGVDYDQAIVHL